MSKEKEELLSQVDQFSTPRQAISVLINVMTGIGPIIIPAVFREAGVLLSTLFTIFISFLSYLTFEFVVEAMSISNAITQHRRQKDGVNQSETDDQSYRIKQDDNQNDIQSTKEQENFEEQSKESSDLQSNNNQKKDFQMPVQKLQIMSDDFAQAHKFQMHEKFEYGEMGSLLWSKKSNTFITLVLAIYLIGILIAKCISTSTIMAETFHHVPILQKYEFWLCLFFGISALFSFKNVQSTKVLQMFILVVRCLTIGFMIIGCILQIISNGIQPISTPEYPLVHLGGFESFFSNTVLAFALHHSIPSIVSPVRPESQIAKVTKKTFSFACGMYLVLPILATLAFGTDLIGEDGLKYFSDDFKQSQPAIFYISSFYMFLNITAFPVLTITTRNNLMKLISPSKIPAQSWRITRYTLVYTLFIVIPIFTIAISVQDIQVVLDIVGGLFGVMLMMIIPSYLVIKGRKMLKQEGLDNNINSHRTVLSQEWVPKAILYLSILFLMMDIYIISKKDMF